MIAQGDIYCVDLGSRPIGSAPGFRHPMMVIQNDAINRSRINTVVVCGLTSNLSLAEAPGNVLLRKGEANPPRRSVVNVSQLVTIDKSTLLEKIGCLSKSRVLDVVHGIALLLAPTD